MSGLFITGGGGFVGQRVLRALAAMHYPNVRVLLHRQPTVDLREAPSSWSVVRGSISEPASWRDALSGVDTVLHLASSTGKASRGVHHDVIAHGTARLSASAYAAGVRRLLFVSSIAAGFADRRHYHYAAAKAAAEDMVRSSSLEHLIVRPTMVLGPGSAILGALRALACGPVPLVFGDGSLPVQPIHVDDLAALLVGALAHPFPGAGPTLTVGGPEVLTLEDLIQRIRRSSGARPSRAIHVPIEPLRSVLAGLEPLMLPLLPFTAGQLSSFSNSGDAGEPSSLAAELWAATGRPLRSIEEMIVSPRHVD
jgi:uncharacterized protein YbjT (DUF2867 family)